MSDTVKGAIIGAVITGGIAIALFFMEQSATERRFQEQLVEENKRFVETMAEYYKDVDKDMSYKEAIQASYEEYKKNEKQVTSLSEQVESLKKATSDVPAIEFPSPSFVNDGLKEKDVAEKAVAIIDGKTYYSEYFLNSSIDKKLSYDSSQKTIFYNTENGSINAETKVDLFEANVLYDGLNYHLYSPSESDTFAMASKTYNKGFTIWDDHSLFGEGEGYALFDPQGKYSKIIFDVGHTNSEYKADAVLKVFLNGEYHEEYQLKADSSPKPLSIDLNYADDMKLLISADSSTIYGFVNVILEY